MAKCSQCGNNAIYQIEGGHLLCLDCYYKMQSIEQQQLAFLIAQKNYYIDQIEATVGLPGTLPRHHIPQAAPVINKNINISNSTVGAVNTGYIESLNVNLSFLAEHGHEELAKQVESFANSLMKEESVSDTIKSEVLEQIEFISRQLVAKEPPKKGLIKSILSSIPVLIASSESLLNIWNGISTQISNFIR